MRQVQMLDLRAEYELIKGAVDSAIAGCLDHQRWIFGPEVKALQERVGAYLKVRNCIGSSSGTEALVISLRALAIRDKGREFFGRDDEIITTSFTFAATGNAIDRAGATPVFVDTDPVTFNIDADRIEEYLVSGNNKVAGIVPVHPYGQACDMDRILGLAERHGLFVVEDTAQAFGAEYGRTKLGTMGDAGAYSFFPSKNLGGFGDGGMIATRDDRLAEIAGMLIRQGGRDIYNVSHVGYNARLDTIQAAILLAKLGRIDGFNSKRAEVAALYHKGFQDIEGLTPPKRPCGEERRHVYNQYTIRVGDGRRDRLQEFLRGKGISTMVYYPLPLHRMEVFKGTAKSGGSMAVTEKMTVEVLSLPIGPLQKEEDTLYVIDSVREFFNMPAASLT